MHHGDERLIVEFSENINLQENIQICFKEVVKFNFKK